MKRLRKLWRSPLFRFVLDCLILVVGIAGCALLAKPSYQVFREWRTDKMATLATIKLSEGDFQEAKRLSKAVLLIHRNRHDMLVVLQRSMEALKDPNAAQLSRMLMVHPDATEEDRIRGFRDTCASMPIALVSAIWQSMGREKAQSPDYFVPFATRWIDEGLSDDRGILLIHRSDLTEHPELRLQAVRELMRSERDPLLVQSQFHIADMISEGGKTALPAFRLLAEVPLEKFRPGGFPDLEAWIGTRQEATVDDHLLALIQKRQRFPGRLSELGKDAIARFGDKDPAAVGRWLNQHGMAGKTLDLLPAEMAASDAGPFLARADALIALERWPEATEWLATPPPGKVPMLELHSRRMMCDGKPGEPMRQGLAWKQALLEVGAGADPNALLEFSRRMYQAGIGEIADEALVAALRTGRGRLPFWEQIRHLFPKLRERQQGQAMFEIASVMARYEPTNAEVLIEALDLESILGKSQPAALVERVRQLEKLLPAISNERRFRELKATALLQAEDAAAALAACGPAISEPDPTSDRLIAVAAVAKAILNETDDSSQLLARVGWNRMLREEKQFFTRMLAELSAPGTTEPIGNRFDPKILPPTDETFEVPPAPEVLPPLEGEFGKAREPEPLKPIPDSIRSQFEPKAPPPEDP